MRNNVIMRQLPCTGQINISVRLRIKYSPGVRVSCIVKCKYNRLGRSRDMDVLILTMKYLPTRYDYNMNRLRTLRQNCRSFSFFGTDR